jgi:hypothetical protein
MFAIIDERLHKSCALCSRVLGEHVYHVMPAFGIWHAYKDQRPGPQSECVIAFRARADSPGTRFADVPYAQLAGMLPTLPADGFTCATRGLKPRTAEDGEVAAMLEVLRHEAEEDLVTDRPLGRQGASPNRANKPATSRPQSQSSYTFTRPLADQVREDLTKPKPAPTVLRRRAGVVQSASRSV